MTAEWDVNPTATVTYKGRTLTYRFFYELTDFIADVDDLSWVRDEDAIIEIAQRLDAEEAA